MQYAISSEVQNYKYFLQWRKIIPKKFVGTKKNTYLCTRLDEQAEDEGPVA